MNILGGKRFPTGSDLNDVRHSGFDIDEETFNGSIWVVNRKVILQLLYQ